MKKKQIMIAINKDMKIWGTKMMIIFSYKKPKNK